MTTGTLAALLAAVRANPGDRELRLIAADAAAEAGQELLECWLRWWGSARGGVDCIQDQYRIFISLTVRGGGIPLGGRHGYRPQFVDFSPPALALAVDPYNP